MAIKKWEDFKDEEVEQLTPAQYEQLEANGEVDIPDAPAAEKKPEGKEAPPEQDGEKPPEEEKPEDDKGDEGKEQPPEKEPEKKEPAVLPPEEVQRQIAGLKEEIVRLRHKNREIKEEKPQESELVKRILSLPDGEFLTSETVKEAIKADQDKEAADKTAKEQRIAQVEESKELAMARYTDYEPVIKDGLPAYIQSLPEDRRTVTLKMIAESHDPAELAYTFGQRGMSLVKKPADVKPNNEVKKQPETEAEKEQPVILRSGKGKTVSPADKSLEELVFGGYSVEQLEKMAADAENERSKGG
ncbi:MAG: hypothetical protein PHF74_05610 [Dehalococcoidales bacterium]|nr:hypothetical protein [Dehalococcoidales bacterium]